MRRSFLKREHLYTAFVLLDTRKCQACWKCLEVCSSNVIGKINLPWHKHVRLINPGACIGCMKCVKVCGSNAFVKSIKKE